MKGLIVFLSLSLSFLTSSCSHYVGTLDDPNSVGVDNQIDIYPRVLLSVFAEYEEVRRLLFHYCRARNAPGHLVACSA